jgi:hypothetical protein
LPAVYNVQVFGKASGNFSPWVRGGGEECPKSRALNNIQEMFPGSVIDTVRRVGVALWNVLLGIIIRSYTKTKIMNTIMLLIILLFYTLTVTTI